MFYDLNNFLFSCL